MESDTLKPDNFEKLPTQIGQRSGAPDTHTLQDGTAEYEDFGGMNDHALILETLSSLYPDISVESLAEVLHVNNGNLSEAIDMLEQFECEGFGPNDFPETSVLHISNVRLRQCSSEGGDREGEEKQRKD